MTRPTHSIGFLLVLTGVLVGCTANRPRATSAGLQHLGNHSFKITTASPAAQSAFDRGLMLAYSFSHYAAEQEFRRAMSLDPDCAMAYWGIALVNGPHINYPLVPQEKAAVAWEALTKAQSLAVHARPLEQALIRALGTRYANPQPDDRSPLDTAYADAMRELWRENPNNADIGALCAEALMDLHPWDLWKAGQPQAWTPEIVQTVERVLQLDPKHPGANHFYIHIMEASPQPEKAVPAADALRTLVPNASHMVHMPAHIYIRVGRWEDAAASNRDAMKVDALYRAAYPRSGFYAMYMAHNTHFLAFVSMMQGRRADTVRLARQMVSEVPDDFLKNYTGIADGFMIFASEALMRFGMWEEILREPEPPATLPLSRALWHFTRTSALTALGRADEARAERAVFDQAVALVPKDSAFGNNSAASLLAIAGKVLDGETSAKAGKFDESIANLREAAQLEDNLLYDEPPDWIQPVRHTLGAVLLRAGKTAEAEAVYREDLQRFPENGWSLRGLRDALRQQGKDADAKLVDARVAKAWAAADVHPTTTCYCQSGN